MLHCPDIISHRVWLRCAHLASWDDSVCTVLLGALSQVSRFQTLWISCAKNGAQCEADNEWPVCRQDTVHVFPSCLTMNPKDQPTADQLTNCAYFANSISDDEIATFLGHITEVFAEDAW